MYEKFFAATDSVNRPEKIEQRTIDDVCFDYILFLYAFGLNNHDVLLTKGSLIVFFML